MKRAFCLLSFLAFVALLSVQIYQRYTAAKQDSSRQRRAAVVAVEVRPIQKGVLRDVALFTGTLQPNSYVAIAPKVAGRVEKLLVNIGQRIKRGQLIALLDDDEYTQQVEQARAELEVARATVEENKSALVVALREFERAQTLRQKKIASESELDAAKAQYDARDSKHKVALAQVVQKEAALKAAQIRLSYTKITASWENSDDSRIVGERFVDEGAMLTANAPIVSILDIHALTAVIYVIEQDYSKMQVGQDAAMATDAFPGRTFTGKIVRIAPLLKETSRQARVEIEIPNPEGILKPGMFIRAQIEFARKENATVVPISALVKREGRQGVFIADTQQLKAQFVPVTLGIMNGEVSEVVEPALSGFVVTMGHHLLEDGTAISLPDAKAGAASARKDASGPLSRSGARP